MGFSTERKLDSSGLSVAPPMRPRAATSTIAPPPVRGPSARSRRQEGESGDEALEANTEAVKGEVPQSRTPSKSHFESSAKNVGSFAQSDDPGRIDDAGAEQTSDDEGNIRGPDDYSNWVGYDDDQGYFDNPIDGLEGFDQYGEEHDEDSNQLMDFTNDEGDIGERTQPKRGRERAESGNPRLKKSGRQSITHSNAPTAPPTRDPSPSQFEDQDLQGASRTTGGIFRGKATGGHLKWGDAPQFMDEGPEYQSAPMGKVFLFSSHDEDARPHLSITTQTASQLPPILKKLSAKYSPIRSKCILLYN